MLNDSRENHDDTSVNPSHQTSASDCLISGSVRMACSKSCTIAVRPFPCSSTRSLSTPARRSRKNRRSIRRLGTQHPKYRQQISVTPFTRRVCAAYSRSTSVFVCKVCLLPESISIRSVSGVPSHCSRSML